MKTGPTTTTTITTKQFKLIAGLFTALICFGFSSTSQAVLQKVLDKTLGSSGNDSLFEVHQTSDGGYILNGSATSGTISGDKSMLGTTNILGSGTDAWIIKTASNGSITWQVSYGGSGNETGRSIQQTSDGGYIAAVASQSIADGNKTTGNYGAVDFWILKLDGSGNVTWQQEYGGSGTDTPVRIIKTADGGYIVGGTSDSGISGNKTEASRGFTDYWIVKLNSDGTKAWDHTYGGSSNETFKDIKQTSDGGYIVLGDSNSLADGDKTDTNRSGTNATADFWILKLNSSGTIVWQKTIGTTIADTSGAIAVAGDGSFFICGATAGTGGDKSSPNIGGVGGDFWVIKLNSSGNIIWERSVGGPTNDQGFSVVADSNGGCTVAGSATSGIGGDKTENNYGGTDYWIVQLDSSGNVLSDKSIGGSLNDTPAAGALDFTSDGGYIIGGTSNSGVSGNKTESNRGGNDYWFVKVKNVNSAPVALNQSPVTNEDQQKSITLSATDAENDTITYTIASNPLHGTVTGIPPNVIYHPDADYNGLDSFTFTASDGSLSSTGTITITVNPVNDAPTFGNIANDTIDELVSYTANYAASDVDGDTLSYSLTNAPAGATINSSTGVFSWTPSETQNGSFTFQVVADDGTTTTSKSITLFVDEVNSAPVLSGVPPSATINELTTLTFDANATDSDVPAQTLTFSLVGAPAGASINSSTGSFSWTPSESQNGNFTFTVKVSDGTASDTQTVSVTVNEVNSAPVLSGVPASATINELAPYTFDASASDSDLPAQTLTFSLVGAPAGASINPSTGVFTWTPSESQNGNFTFTVKVSDGTASDTQDITLTVNEVNSAPTLTGVPATATINELAPYTFTAVGADSDVPAQTLTYSLVTPPTGAAIDGSTGVFNWTPTEAQNGNFSFKVKVSDGVTNYCQAVTLTVNEVNSAPSLTGVPATATINELAPYTFTAVGADSDIPAQTLTYSLVTPPTGATIDGTTGVFNWTPTEAQNGNFSFKVKVSDGVTNYCQAVTLTVNEVNSAPSLTGVPATATINELAPYTFTAVGADSDIPAQTLTYSLVTPPTGATIDASTGVFNWTPTEAQNGNFSFKVKVSDGVTNYCQAVTLTVNEVNSAPVLSNVPATATINELAPYTFTATASDSDLPAQTLTFSLVSAPAGASIDPATGVFTWTPSESQNGNFTFTVKVSDGTASDTQSVTLTVNEVNSAPVLSGVPASATINELATYTFDANASDSDVPVQTLTYSLINAPAGATINSSTGAFSWTPSESQNGNFTFTVKVSDGTASDTQDVTLTVNEVNSLPTLSGVPATATINELAPYTFTAVGADSDIPAQTLSYSLVTPPTGATIDPVTGVFNWTPTESQNGAFTFKVKVSDGVGYYCQSVTLTVNEVNSLPSLTGVPATATINELAPYTFTAVGADSDIPAQTLSYSLVTPPTGATIDPVTGVFNWTPSESQNGDFTFKVKVSDGVGYYCQSVTLTVKEVNSAPVLSNVPATATINELAPYTFTATASDSDLPAQTLTFSLVSAPAGASIDPDSGVFTWTPSESQNGNFTFTVKVSDGTASDTQSVTLTVNEVNSAPVLSGVPATATINELAAYTFDANATDSDVPSQTLTYSLINAPAGATIDSSTGAFSWTPSESQNGNFTFTVKVSDGTASDTQSVTLTVNEVNSAPVLAGVPATATINELAAYTFTATATDSDLPAQNLTFSLVSAPAGASIDPDSGVFTWTPSESQNGNFTFTVKVSDGTASDTQSVTLTVNEVNSAPVLSGVPASATINQSSAYTFTASATDSDLPAQTLTFSLVNAPAGAAIDPSTGVFTWTPSTSQSGAFTFTVKVSDGIASDSQSITITVNTVSSGNTAPVLSNVPATVTINELVAYTFTATATDSDLPAQTLTFSLIGAPTGATIGSSTGKFTWTPTEAQNGVFTFQVAVSDGIATTTKSITITVNEVNKAPVLSNVPTSATIKTQKLYTFSACATDSDIPVQTLTFSLIGAPTGATINSTTGVFKWTPTYSQVGVFTFKVAVTDGVVTTTKTVTLTVTNGNVAPTLGSITLKSGTSTISKPVVAGLTVSASATLKDANLPNDTITAKWNWDDGSAPTTGTITLASGVYTVSGSHVFPTPGVYLVSLTVTDIGGLTAKECFRYLVVYSNTGTYSVGEGYFTSPAGALKAKPTQTGRADFGFEAKYLTATTTLDQYAEFQFHDDTMYFASDSLVKTLTISGYKATFTGTGTINAAGNYGFMVSVIDGQVTNGGGYDKIRVKIWDINNANAVVYDSNLTDTSAGAIPAIKISGGSITIH